MITNQWCIKGTCLTAVDTSNAVKIKDKKGGANKEAADASVGRYLTIYTTSGTTKAGFAPFAIGFTLGFLV